MSGICPMWMAPIQIPSASGVTSKVGTVNFTGDNTADTFTIPHGLGSVPSYANVVAKSPAAIGDYSVVWDITNIYVMYSFPPANGTITLTFIATA